MCSEIKRLKELSECKHLMKTDRDAIIWALERLGESVEKEQKETKAKYSDDDYKLAEWMDARVKKITKSDKVTNLKAWANTIRIMTEVDGRTHKEITDMFDWCNRDQFWFRNIMSPDKLRAQWDKLTLQRDSKPMQKAEKSAQSQLIARANSGELYQTNQNFYFRDGKKWDCAADYFAGKPPIEE